MIERTRKIQINPTPYEIAKEFCSMTEDEQALFFNSIEIESTKWKRSFVFQLQAVTDSECLSNGGRDIMRLIGEYSHKE